MISERDITAFLHTRLCALLMLAFACIQAWAAYVKGGVISIGGSMEIGLTPTREWIDNPFESLIASVTSAIVIGVLIIYINRAFNIFRSLTSLVAGIFFIMQTALPSVMSRFYGGDMMGVLMMINVVLLFGSWSDNHCQRRIYLIFFLISLAGFTDLAYLLYLPVFLLGCVQMRIFDPRTVIAAGMGVITPPWILFGLGIVNPSELHWPQLIGVWSLFNTPEAFQALAVTGVTIFIGIGFTAANLLKILSYNSRIRAYNGFLSLLFIATCIFAIINFNNFTFYIPLLNCLTAYQIAHFFTYRRNRRSYIPLLALTGIYIGFYIRWLLG